MKKKLSVILCAILASTIVFAGCANNSGSSDSGSNSTTNSASSAATGEVKTTLDKIDMTKWQYNADDKVYYQIGLKYCSEPANEEYEKLAVFVPAGYFNATENSDGTYTCELKSDCAYCYAD